MRFRKGLGAFALIVALCAGATAGAQQRGGNAPALVADLVRQETSGETAQVVGRFVALRGGPVAARIGGAVDEVLVAVGDRVEEGQPLARLALDRLRAEKQRRQAMLNLAAAQIGVAKANLKLAQQSESRLSRLRSSAAFSEALLSDKQREAERAAAQLQEAEADYARARAELRLADVDLAYAEVRAPYPGVVTERHVDVGAFVPLGGSVATLLGDLAFEIEAEIPSERAATLRPGASQVRLSYGGVQATVPVRAVLPRETGVSRTRAARFGPLPDSLAAKAIANASVSVGVPVGGAGAVTTVHKDAIVRQAAGAIAYVAAETEDPGIYTAEPRQVRLGDAIGNRLIVLSGLNPGEPVVVRGNESVRPGQKIRITGVGGEKTR